MIFSPIDSSVEVAIKHVEWPKYRMKEAIQKLVQDFGLTVSTYEFQQAWKPNNLKDSAKGLAFQLGGRPN